MIEFDYVNTYIPHLWKSTKRINLGFEPNAEQELVFKQVFGSARFVWNQILAVSFEMLANNERINKVNLVNKFWITKKKKPECAFLENSSNGVSLQQKCVILDAWGSSLTRKNNQDAWQRLHFESHDVKVGEVLNGTQKAGGEIMKTRNVYIVGGAVFHLWNLWPHIETSQVKN